MGRNLFINQLGDAREWLSLKNSDDGDSLWAATDMKVKDYLSTGILVS